MALLLDPVLLLLQLHFSFAFLVRLLSLLLHGRLGSLRELQLAVQTGARQLVLVNHLVECRVGVDGGLRRVFRGLIVVLVGERALRVDLTLERRKIIDLHLALNRQLGLLRSVVES